LNIKLRAKLFINIFLFSLFILLNQSKPFIPSSFLYKYSFT